MITNPLFQNPMSFTLPPRALLLSLETLARLRRRFHCYGCLQQDLQLLGDQTHARVRARGRTESTHVHWIKC